MAEGYRSQVGPRAGQPLPRVTAEDYGAGVADGIARFADTAYRAKKGEYLIDRRQRENAEWAEFQVRFAKEREAAATAAREARQKDDPEHSTRMAAHWQEAEERLLSGLSFDDLKGRARASVSSWGVQFRTGEADWQTVRSAEIATENFRDQRDAGANRVRRMDNAGDYAAELKIQREALDGMRISDEIRGKLWQETEQTFAVSFLQGRMDEDPVGAMALIESGAFDEVLTPAQVEALKNASAVEVRRAEAAAEREVAAAEREVREELEILTTREADGIDVAAEAAALRPRLEALGMEKELERLAVISQVDPRQAARYHHALYRRSGGFLRARGWRERTATAGHERSGNSSGAQPLGAQAWRGGGPDQDRGGELGQDLWRGTPGRGGGHGLAGQPTGRPGDACGADGGSVRRHAGGGGDAA